MPTMIEDLEREIKLFQNNIKNSNELMGLLASVVSSTKSHADAFEAQTTTLCEKFVELPPAVREIFQNETESFMQSLRQEHASYQASIERLTEKYAQKIAHSENLFGTLNSQLESRYNAFICELESTNVSKLYKYCQDMNKSINVKLGFMLGGIVIAIVASVVSFFI